MVETLAERQCGQGDSHGSLSLKLKQRVPHGCDLGGGGKEEYSLLHKWPSTGGGKIVLKRGTSRAVVWAEGVDTYSGIDILEGA
jgi:hypothetical protein